MAGKSADCFVHFTNDFSIDIIIGFEKYLNSNFNKNIYIILPINTKKSIKKLA